MHTTLPIECACVAAPGGDRSVETQAWNDHPAFRGVRLKDLITSADTDGGFSCHLVRVDPGCSLMTHDHPAQTEVHQVAAGDAVCTLDDRELAYRPGEMAVIPMGRPHSVTAGDQGVTLVATFCPPLK